MIQDEGCLSVVPPDLLLKVLSNLCGDNVPLFTPSLLITFDVQVRLGSVLPCRIHTGFPPSPALFRMNLTAVLLFRIALLCMHSTFMQDTRQLHFHQFSEI
jgi:hypothetical protein